MAISDKVLAAVLRTWHHTDEINTGTVTPGDHIDSEPVDDGHLIRAHRPGDEFDFAADDVDPSEHDPEWIVDRAGDFSSVLTETDTDEMGR